MKTYTLNPVSPGSEGYDEDYPTKQTELLCLDLRKILYGLSGAVVSAPETGEDSHANAKLQLVVDAIDNSDVIDVTGVSDLIASVDALTVVVEDKLDVLSARIFDPDKINADGLSGVINEFKDLLDVVFIGQAGSVFKTYAEGEGIWGGTSLMVAISERIKELSEDILLASTPPTSISVYDKVILTREGLVTEEL